MVEAVEEVGEVEVEVVWCRMSVSTWCPDYLSSMQVDVVVVVDTGNYFLYNYSLLVAARLQSCSDFGSIPNRISNHLLILISKLNS